MKHKLTKVISSLILTLLTSTFGLTQSYEWGAKIGGAGYDSANSVTIDATGNVYTTGTFQSGTLDCDPGPGVYNLTRTGGGYYNIFITKLDASGNFVWAKGIAGSDGLDVHSLKVDAGGNLFIVGEFDGTADFDPSAAVYNLTTTGTLSETFILKLNNSGDFVWAKKITNSNTTSFSIGLDFEIDPAGNLYLTGVLSGTADFNPGVGVFNLTATSGFTTDIFICKLDASASFLWAKVIGNSGSEESEAIAIDASGSIYITGYYQNTVDFDPGAGISNLVCAGFYDIFIAKYDSSGNYIWAKSLGGTDLDKGTDLKVDASGNVYATGTFKGTADFDPGSGTFNVTAIGYEDMYVIKLNSAGNLLWVKVFSGASNSISRCLDIDGSGNVYVGGQFASTFDFDPSAGTYNLVSAGDYDAFISKLDASGNFVWAKSFGALNVDLIWEIKMDGGGKLHACGGFGGTVDLDPTSGVQNFTSSGENDVLVLKWSQCATVTPTISIAAAPGTTISAGTNVTFTASITNGGTTPVYQWKLNGNNVGTNTSSYSSSTLVNGDVVTCSLMSNAPCANPTTTGSNALTITVTGSSVSNDEPCGATPLSVNTTCTYSIFSNAGATNSVGIPAHSCQSLTNNDVWFSFVAPASGQTIIKTVASGMTDGVMSIFSGTCSSLTAIDCNDDSSPGINFMPLISASGLTPGNTYFIRISSYNTSNSGLFDICLTDPNPIATPSISISANPSGTICPGTQVIFSATAVNPGGSPAYQWKKNGTNVGTGLTTYTTSTLVNGDVITCVLSVGGSPYSSNAITMSVSSSLTPTVSIISNQGNSICTGTSVVFNASQVNGGSAPTYQWQKNGANVGTGLITYTTSSLVSGDVITCVLTSNNSCASPSVVLSNAITMTVSSSLTPSITVISNQGNSICTGTSVVFNASATNGGSSPTYQWQKNGTNVGTGLITYSPTSLASGDVITCILTSNNPCANPNVVSSNSITMTVSSSLTPSVAIISNQGNSICTGTSVVFTASPVNGGSTPTYQWQKNGANVGTGLMTYTTSILANGDVITCILTSDNPCANPNVVSSNTITMSVGSSLTPSVTITSNQGNSICTGSSVIFTASPTNGGSTPTYQWKKNGANVGTGLVTYTTNVLVNGDVITCFLTSNSACVNTTTAMSNSLSMTVSNPVVSIQQTGQTLSATSGFNSYQWSLNGNTINGATNSDYNAGSVNGNYSVSVGNLNGCVATASYNYTTSGISTLSNPNFNIYPNPSNGNITISFRSSEARTVEVIDLTGKVVYSTSSNQEELKMNLGDLLPSIYNVIITNENGVKNFERLMISK